MQMKHKFLHAIYAVMLVSPIATRPASLPASSQYKNRASLHSLHHALHHNPAHTTRFSSQPDSGHLCIRLPFSMSTMTAVSRAALCVLVLLAVLVSSTTEAAKLETWNDIGCSGGPTNTFLVGGNTCQTFIDQGSVRVTEVSASTRFSVHNQQNCEQASSVGQAYGAVSCFNQGATKLRAVWIQG